MNIVDKDKVLNDDDIKWASGGLRRLQKFYAISASDMAAGSFNGRNIGDEIDSEWKLNTKLILKEVNRLIIIDTDYIYIWILACECYVILRNCLEEHDMYGVFEWANETYNKWIINGHPNCVDIDQLYYYAISSSMYTGKLYIPKCSVLCLTIVLIFYCHPSFLIGFSLSPLYNPNINNDLKDATNIAQYILLMRNDVFEFKVDDIFNRYNVRMSILYFILIRICAKYLMVNW